MKNTIKVRGSHPKDSFEVFSSDFLKTPHGNNKASKPAELKSMVSNKSHPQPVSKDEYQEIYDELRQIDPEETIIWIGRSTQLIHAVAYTFCLVFAWLLFPLAIAYILYLQTKNTIYVVTDQRLRVYSGIFVKRIDDVELYRVKDTVYLQPLILGRFGYSNILLITSDVNWANELIPGIMNGRLLREKIRKVVEIAREKKGVREVDYYTRGEPLPQGL